MVNKIYTPWGIADSIEVLTEGIVFYSTPSHGGFKVSREVLETMEPGMRNADGWYEEDVECLKVIVSFPHLFTETKPAAARAAFDYWFNADGTYKQR